MTMTQYWYKLWLQYDNNFFYLAPRASIGVQEPSDMETLTSNSAGGCVGCGTISDRTFKFNLFFEAGCSLASAWALYNALVAFLAASCNKDLLLYRQVQDETPLVYKVTSFELRMVDPQSQYSVASGSNKVLSIEVVFGLTVWPPTGQGLVKLTRGSTGTQTRSSMPIFQVGVTLVAPVVNMVLNNTPTPLAIAVTLKAPTVSLV